MIKLLVIFGLALLVGCSNAQKELLPASPLQEVERNAQSRQAESAFREQRFAEAARLFTLQAQSSSREAEYKAWFNAGASHWNALHKSESLESYEQAVAVNPLYLKGHLRLANRYNT